MLQAVEAVNQDQKHVLGDKIRQHFGDLTGRTIALWGLAFKPNTDDMREAPSRVLIQDLFNYGAQVRAYDPVAMNEARHLYAQDPRITFCATSQLALEGADALAIVTEWQEFRSPDFERIRETLRQPVVFDGRNLYDPAQMELQGLAYYAIGRGRSLP